MHYQVNNLAALCGCYFNARGRVISDIPLNYQDRVQGPQKKMQGSIKELRIWWGRKAKGYDDNMMIHQ